MNRASHRRKFWPLKSDMAGYVIVGAVWLAITIWIIAMGFTGNIAAAVIVALFAVMLLTLFVGPPLVFISVGPMARITGYRERRPQPEAPSPPARRRTEPLPQLGCLGHPLLQLAISMSSASSSGTVKVLRNEGDCTAPSSSHGVSAAAPWRPQDHSIIRLASSSGSSRTTSPTGTPTSRSTTRTSSCWQSRSARGDGL